MDVNDVRLFAAHQLAKLLMYPLVPDGVPQQDQGVDPGHLIVARLVQNHVMAMRAQQIGLLGEDLILASGLQGMPKSEPGKTPGRRDREDPSYAVMTDRRP